jgi:uncharacterized spore protein YtfJ
MSNGSNGVEVIPAGAAKNQEEAIKILGRLFDVADPKTIYNEPVTAGEYTVITASEVTVGMGLGFGGGGGESAQSEEQKDVGGGMGGGGGGASAGRPVAAIVLGPHGVRVEPIFDLTKVAIALFTALGAMVMARRAMRKGKIG